MPARPRFKYRPILAAVILATVLFGLAPAALADSVSVTDQGSPNICQGPGIEVVTPLATVTRTAADPLFASGAQITESFASDDPSVRVFGLRVTLPSSWQTSPAGTRDQFAVSADISRSAALGRHVANITATTTGPTVSGTTGTITTSFTLTYTVVDCTPPVVTVPANVSLVAISPNGAPYIFNPTPSATDNVAPAQPTVTCDHTSGETFPIGATTVTCSATDAAGNKGSASFTVTVGTAPPVISGVPGPITQEATGPFGATVTYRIPTAVDSFRAGVPVSCVPAPGSVFAVGPTTVSCAALDAFGGKSESTFTVTVTDTTRPVVTVPADVVTEATGASGATVSFAASAKDPVDGDLPATCDPPSDAVFPLGTTIVTCTATDKAGNTGRASFTVTVRDTAKPVVTVPADITVPPTGPSGAVATFTASATDAVSGPVPVTCSPASGSIFAPGATTTVTCTAQDAAGNTGTGTFTVTVGAFTLSGFYLPVFMSTGSHIFYNPVVRGQTEPLIFRVAAGSAAITSTSVVKSLTTTPVSCSTRAETGTATPVVTTGGTVLRYSPLLRSFILNWKVPKQPGTCLKVVLTTADNSTLTAWFRIW